jgi:hypothetical protein
VNGHNSSRSAKVTDRLSFLFRHPAASQ